MRNYAILGRSWTFQTPYAVVTITHHVIDASITAVSVDVVGEPFQTKWRGIMGGVDAGRAAGYASLAAGMIRDLIAVRTQKGAQHA